MKNALAALIGERFFRMAVWALPILLGVACVAYVLIRLTVLGETEHLVVQLQGDVLAIIAHTERRDTELSDRIRALEQEVFGSVEKTPPSPRVPPVALWQRNRDQELRERIRKLEWWRYQQESR